MLQTITSIQAAGITQKRNFWLEGLKTGEKGELFYFVGCRPYFDVVFRDINAGSIKNSRNIVSILNAMGEVPVVSNDERCCGHDALWNGDEDKFKKLASRNIELIRSSGAKRVVFTCPEGYLTFKLYYPRYFGDLGFEPVHILDLLEEKVSQGIISLKESKSHVTYHDPCRLGRLAGIFDAPRAIIKAMPGVEFTEMPRSRENAVCCGTSGWMNCSSCSKQIQLERLKEASATGADTLVTACPKCQIHFRCAKSAFDLGIEIVDLYDMVADSIVNEAAAV
jgi:Fe-S oxidoreductase